VIAFPVRLKELYTSVKQLTLNGKIVPRLSDSRRPERSLLLNLVW